jgi:hypothetical protein
LRNETAKLARYIPKKVDRLLQKTMALEWPTAQISGGRAAFVSQRVEDNAFHHRPIALTFQRF